MKKSEKIETKTKKSNVSKENKVDKKNKKIKTTKEEVKQEVNKEFDSTEYMMSVFRNPKKVAIISIVTILFVVFVFFISSYRKTYKLENLIDFKVTGYSGYAKLSYELKDNPDKVKEVLNTSKLTFSKKENIANGDSINIIIEYNDEIAKKNKIKITEQYVYQVSGLEETKTLDLFEGLKIEYSNKSPYVKINLTNDSLGDNKYNINYSIKSLDTEKSSYEKDYFKNGEKYEITATYNSTKALEDGYVVSATTKEIEITDQDSYIKEATQITSEMKDTLVKEMIKDIKEGTDTKYRRKIYCQGFYCFNPYKDDSLPYYELSQDPELIYMYVGSKDSVRRGTDYKDNIHTGIAGVFKVTFKGSPNTVDGRDPIYCVVHYDNIYIKADGTLSEYEKNDNYVSCNTTNPKTMDLKNYYVTGNYQYTGLIDID